MGKRVKFGMVGCGGIFPGRGGGGRRLPGCPRIVDEARLAWI